MYTTNLRLKHNEIPAKVDIDTGEVLTINRRPNNFPDGKSKLDYEEFGMINIKMLRVLREECSRTEISIIMHMVDLSEFGTNSLRPLNDETSYRELGKVFDLDHKTIKDIFVKLKYLGVYLQLNITEVDGAKEYWVLNPYISWKGRLKTDSLFITFANTRIVKLL